MPDILSKSAEPLYQPEPSTIPEASQAQVEVLKSVFESQGQRLINALCGQLTSQGVEPYTEARELAHELFSELYLEAMKTAHKFDAAQSARSWLLAIGRNLIKRKLHSRSIKFNREELATDTTWGEGEADADKEIFERVAALGQPIAIEENEAAREILDLVPGDDQEIIKLFVIHEMQGEQVASVLNIAPAAARQRLSRALKRLKVAYQKHIHKMEGHHE